MAGISGLDVTKTFREYETRRSHSSKRRFRQKIIGMTSNLHKSLGQATLECGMDSFSLKTSPSDFIRAIKEALAMPNRYISYRAITTDMSVGFLMRARSAHEGDSHILDELLRTSHSLYFPSWKKPPQTGPLHDNIDYIYLSFSSCNLCTVVICMKYTYYHSMCWIFIATGQ